MSDSITSQHILAGTYYASNPEPNVSTCRYTPETLYNKFYLQLDLKNHKKAAEIESERRLVEATIAGHLEVIRELLESGVSVDAATLNRALLYASKNYLTPLQIASALGYVDCAKLLIQYQANVDINDRYDVTALHLAAQEGQLLCLKVLLEAGANYNHATKYSTTSRFAIPYLGGTTPLHLAAANNHVDCVSELIQYGADYNSIDEKGRTALYIAAESELSDCVLAQIRYAVRYDILSLPGFETGDTPLHLAVRSGMTECVKELLLLGSDVNLMNYFGFTPLHYAASTGPNEVEKTFEILKLLVLHGYNCDVNRQDALGSTPLHYLVFGDGYVSKKRPDMAQFLIAHGANINIKNNCGVSLLEYEYNSPTDCSVLYAMVESMNIPPHITNIRDFYRNRSFSGLLGNIVPFCALGSMEDPDADMAYKRLALQPSLQFKRKCYSTVSSNPMPLRHLCRYVIRQEIGPKRFRRIKELPLPMMFLRYLLLNDEAFPC